ncbi:histidine kinase [Paenibacillus sp. GD4]|uniref:cache domain-containing sensor histidine kinase n=1 Tax=Paenibacillus sp. GD4 TaxID=3068890 RepID=UPI002796A23D|nr:histidine kinase [Paenibacillus sp. GD4]MDQ1914686.1 histidine kinase [Paenibacillus sp. GD4]
MRKILSALLSSITGQRRVGTNTNIRYVKQSDSTLARKFFSDNLRRIIVLSLIPLAVLGSLSIFIADRYIRHSVEQNSESQLTQLSELTQVIPAELDSLSLSFEKDPKIKTSLQAILNTESFSFEELEALFYLRNVIDVPANSKPFIHSIYVYYDNPYGRFLSSRDGVAQLDTALDRHWFELFRTQSFAPEELKTERRMLPQNLSTNHSVEVLTVYMPFALSVEGGYRGLIAMNVLPAYFKKTLQQLSSWTGSYHYIADAGGMPLMHSDPFGGGVPLPMTEMNAAMTDSSRSLQRFAHQDNWVSVMQTPRLQWQAVSIIPTAALYSLPRTIVLMTVGLALLSLLLSAMYALWITRKNYHQISQIIHVLDAADQAEDKETSTPGPGPSPIQDVYELIVRNILDTFLEQKYLRIQLSERQVKMELLELKALQSQMNPHFMSNTLHSIYWKAFQLTRSPNDACAMIEQLSDLLEYALRGSDDAVQLKDELANVRGYIELQRTRFAEKLQVLWEVDEGAEACRVVKISLQPLVENSIHIGLEAQQELMIKIRCRLRGDQLLVTVIDNGPGMSKERLTRIHESLYSDAAPGKHLGLASTSKRLTLHYGRSPLLRVRSKAGLGTAITLTFPQEGLK